MAKTDFVYQYTYKSSLKALQVPGGVVVLLGTLLLLRSLWVIIHDHSAAGVFMFLERFVFGSALLGLVGYLYLMNRDKIITITPKNIMCVEPGKTLAIPMSELKVYWPKRGKKTDRTLMLSDGSALFKVEERFFPEFKDLLVKLKSFDKERDKMKSEITLD